MQKPNFMAKDICHVFFICINLLHQPGDESSHFWMNLPLSIFSNGAYFSTHTFLLASSFLNASHTAQLLIPYRCKTVWKCRLVTSLFIFFLTTGITVISPFIRWRSGGSSFHCSCWYHSRRQGQGTAGKLKGCLSKKAVAVAVRAEANLLFRTQI